jgi:hypothetical protein
MLPTTEILGKIKQLLNNRQYWRRGKIEYSAQQEVLNEVELLIQDTSNQENNIKFIEEGSNDANKIVAAKPHVLDVGILKKLKSEQKFNVDKTKHDAKMMSSWAKPYFSVSIPLCLILLIGYDDWKKNLFPLTFTATALISVLIAYDEREKQLKSTGINCIVNY